MIRKHPDIAARTVRETTRHQPPASLAIMNPKLVVDVNMFYYQYQHRAELMMSLNW